MMVAAVENRFFIVGIPKIHTIYYGRSILLVFICFNDNIVGEAIIDLN